MSKDQRKVDRRAVLQYSLASGAAVAATMLGSASPAAQQAASLPIPALTGARVRRVVTGRHPDGKSYVVSDELVDVRSLWTTSVEQPLGAPPAGEQRQIARATGETRCFVATIQPSKDPKPNLTNRVGFHQTPGIAYCWMLNGEIVFLTDTQEVRLKAGDLVVERNSFHSWRNETDVPVSMFITTVVGGA